MPRRARYGTAGRRGEVERRCASAAGRSRHGSEPIDAAHVAVTVRTEPLEHGDGPGTDAAPDRRRPRRVRSASTRHGPGAGRCRTPAGVAEVEHATISACRPRETTSERGCARRRSRSSRRGRGSRAPDGCDATPAGRGTRPAGPHPRASPCRTAPRTRTWPRPAGRGPALARNAGELARPALRAPLRRARDRRGSRSTGTAPCSPYSSPMNSSGTNGESRTAAAASRGASGPTSAASRSPCSAVADLVVVLGEHDEPLAGQPARSARRACSRGTRSSGRRRRSRLVARARGRSSAPKSA